MTEYHLYDILWQVVQKEKHTNELQLLPKTFYDDTDNFLDTLDKKDGIGNEEDQLIKKNTKRLINDLFERRKQKILIYVAYKKQIPQPPLHGEQEFYNKVVEITRNTKLNNTDDKSKQLLKSLQPIPEIILPSGKKIGPLAKDQTVELTDKNEDMAFLINNSLCVLI